MRRTPIDRTSFESRLAAAHQTLELLHASLAEVMLAADRAPDNAELAAQVADIKVQRDRARERIDDLNAMQAAAGREADGVAHAQRDARIQDLSARAQKASVEMARVLPALMVAVEDVHGPLARYLELGTERARAAQGIQKLMGRPAGGMRLDGCTALVDALVGALARSGLGQIGPTLAPTVSINPPARPPTLSDVESALARDHARLLEVLAAASTATENEVPA